MPATARDRLNMPLAILFALGPFVAGMIRLAQTGKDSRLLWMAAAATAGSLVVGWLVPAAREGRMAPSAIGLATFALATVFTTVTGFALGAKAIFGVLAIAIVMGAFVGASSYFRMRARHSARQLA